MIIAFFKYLGDNKHTLGETNGLEVSTRVGETRNMGWKSLGCAVIRGNLLCYKHRAGESTTSALISLQSLQLKANAFLKAFPYR